MKYILYAAALLFALLSCTNNSTRQKVQNDSLYEHSNATTTPSQGDSVTFKNDNTGTSVGEGTTTSGTTAGSSSSHKDSVK
jgi:hypothetical protein